MIGPVVMDHDEDSKTFAVGFDNQKDALTFIKEQTDSGVFTERQVQFKDNPFGIGPSMLRPLYLKIFGKPKLVYFKDYRTNATINTPPHTDKYWATFISLMEYLQYPRYLIVYKIA